MRGLLTFVVAAIALAAAGMACSGPSSQGDQPVATQAQATSVRRTVVAEAQRIIANNPTPTELPSPTSTQSPICPGAIWWNEARSHVGEVRTVQGPIVGMRPAPSGAAIVEIGQPYPDPDGLVVLLAGAGAAAPPPNGKTVCVAGRIGTAEGRPALQVPGAASMVIVN